MKTEIVGWKEFEVEWPQIRKDMLATEMWGDGLGYPGFYEVFAKEISEDGIDEDIEFWEEIKKNHRNDFRIRIDCQKMIKELIEEKEENLCKARIVSKCGQKLRDYSENGKKGAPPNFLQA